MFSTYQLWMTLVLWILIQLKQNYGTLFFTEYKSAYVSETPIIYHSMARSSPMGVVMPAKVRFK